MDVGGGRRVDNVGNLKKNKNKKNISKTKKTKKHSKYTVPFCFFKSNLDSNFLTIFKDGNFVYRV